MITEDYVSFETAKLLKEKRFDGITNCYYFDGSNEHTLLYSPFKDNYNDGTTNKEFEISSNISSIRISAPTLQMALKWLREKYNLNIEVCLNAQGYEGIITTLFNSDIKITNVLPVSKHKTYEEACEAAIKYCLENLI